MATKTVLIIEDNLAVLASYLQILDTMKLDVIPFVASTYENAQRIFSLESIDLIILDLVLPDVLSTDVLKDIRKRHSEVPILLVTGHPEQLDRQKARMYNIEHFFTKPFQVDALIRAIQSSLSPMNQNEVQ